jgi:hypothetical protein
LSATKKNLKDKMIPSFAYNLIKLTNQSYQLEVEGWAPVKKALDAGDSLRDSA